MNLQIDVYSTGLVIWQSFIILFAILYVYCLIDILRKKFEGSEKLIWLLVVTLIPFIGSILYLIIRNVKADPK